MLFKKVAHYILTALVFFTIDLWWLGVVANQFYFSILEKIIPLRINWMAAAAFYLLYIIGILYFVVYPGRFEKHILSSAQRGALFGFFCYATYDFTNLATIAGWSIQMAAVDILWGTFLTGVVASVSQIMARRMRL